MDQKQFSELSIIFLDIQSILFVSCVSCVEPEYFIKYIFLNFSDDSILNLVNSQTQPYKPYLLKGLVTYF